MKSLRKNIFLLIIFSVLLFIYKNWFTKGLLSAPDLPYYFPERLRDFSWQPYAWSNVLGNGLGGNTLITLYLNTYLSLGVQFLLFFLRIPWSITLRMLFFWPFLVIGTFSSFLLTNTIIKNKNFAVFGVLIYMTNTYILMMIGGGQMGIAMAYSIAPLVLYGFFYLINKSIKIKNIVWYSLVLSLLTVFDLRITYIILISVIIYWVFDLLKAKKLNQALRSFIFIFIIPGIITIFFQSFWLLPLILGRQSPAAELGSAYTSLKSVKFFSFAKFEQTISILSPFWPENIFGKVSFMKPEFLILPVLAYASLLFLKSKLKSKNSKVQVKSKNFEDNSTIQQFNNSTIIYFALLGLIGAFLAKGANDPLGGIYLWCFTHVPGFIMFRDPTKWYTLVVISYSVLIPFSIWKIYGYLKSKVKSQKSEIQVKIQNLIPHAFLMLATLYLILLIMPAWTGQLVGTFKKLSIPSDYVKFGQLVSSKSNFSRILVVPWRNRFVFESENHPILDASTVFNTTDINNIGKMMKAPETIGILEKLAVKYIVIPDDFTKEIFLSNRTYDVQKKRAIENVLDSIQYLNKDKAFKGLTVYEFNKSYGLFYSTLSNGISVSHSSYKINPVTYTVDINTLERPIKVIFSQVYDSNWVLWDGGKIIPSKKTSDGLNSFALTSLITNQVTVYYKNQRALNTGIFISLSLLLILIVFFYIKITKRFKLGKKFHLIILLIILSVLFLLKPKDNSKNILSNKSIWFSKDWKVLKNPFVKGEMILSRYGGDETRFNIANTKSISFKVTSSNDYNNAQGMKVSVDGKNYELTTPNIDKKKLRVILDNSNSSKKHSVIIMHWCGGSYSACDLALRKIDVDNKAVITPSGSVPKKTLAILGDSISVSWGDSNFTYLLADKLGYQLHNAGFFGMSVSEVPGWQSGLRQYYDDIVLFKPDVILVYLGTNDLGHKVPIGMFRNDYEKLIRGIKDGSLTSKIILVGLLRRGDYSSNQVLAYSDIIQKIAEDNKLVYLNPYTWLDETDLKDGLHPALGSQAKFADEFYKNLYPILISKKNKDKQ